MPSLPHPIHAIVVIAVIAIVATAASAGEVLVDGFESVEAWSPNDDGGNAPTVELDTETFVEGASAMRLTYINEPPRWGNITRPVEIPPATTAVTLWLHKHHSGSEAAMYCWLYEEDGDAWVTEIPLDGQPFGSAAPGWYDVTLLVADFRFDPRGPGTRDMPSAQRILIGCNYDDLIVTVDRLALTIREDVSSSEAPSDPATAVESGDEGSALILGGDLPKTDAASDAGALAELLRQAGWGATVVLPGDLERLLDPATVDVLVVPGGPAFPADAVPALRAFLAADGDLLTMGGYAFDQPLSYVDDQWVAVGAGVSAQEVSEGGEVPNTRINSRLGTHGDAMAFDPQQLQIFDPSFVLKRVAGLRAAPNQELIPADVRMPGTLEGYATVSTLGSNQAVFPDLWGRRIPLLETYDAFGRQRGAGGAIVHHFDGPYAGSSWAFFGITNRDLFTGVDAPLAGAVPGILDAITRPRYVRRVTTNYACYRRGESVTVEGEVWLQGDEADPHVMVTCRLLGQVRAEVSGGPEAAGLRSFSVTFDDPSLTEDYATVTAELMVGEEAVDLLETAFCVWDPDIIAAGPKVEIDGSQVVIDGEAVVRLGTPQTGMMWYSEHEDPSVWDADYRAMRDHQIRILRVLHFSPFAEGGYEGKPSNRPEALKYRPEKLCRQTDAMVQLAQKHGIVFFLALHDWLAVPLTEEQYAIQEDWNRFWTERYRDVPGIMYDIQNEPHVPDPPAYDVLVDLYNDMLGEKYGDPESLMAAWGVDELPGEWGSIPFQTGGDEWDDVIAHDYWLFKTELYNFWVRRNAEGILAGDPDALFTVGHLISNIHADKQLGAEHVPYTNAHYYGDVLQFAEFMKFSDRSAVGKPWSIGEFGAQEAHDQRTHGLDGTRDEASIRRYLWYGHVTLGQGMSFACNWSWKDFEGAVFPWGLRYLQDPVSKDVLLAHRAQGLAFLGIDLPTESAAPVCVVMPDCHRLGPLFKEIEDALTSVFRSLFELGVPFALLTEDDLDRIPETTRALIWPLPYCATDATLDRLESWVDGGGSLYFSGTIAFDEDRRVAEGERSGRFGIQTYPTATPSEAPDEVPDAIVRASGPGLVHFVPAPVELDSPEALADIYWEFLEAAGISIQAATPPVQRMQPTTSGPVVLFNAQHEPTLAQYRGLEAELPGVGVALIHDASNGRPAAVHAIGTLAGDDEPLVAGEPEVFVFSLTGESLDESPAALLCPITTGATDLVVMGEGRVLEAEVGELRDGRWTGFERRTLDRTRLHIPEEWVLSLVLIYPAGGRDAAVAALEEYASR
ncbi:MAG: hypothetical protein GF320_17510 [Armatimonadia bacterium]|nr:hypothetical protein [Armatimonadia bacterium]